MTKQELREQNLEARKQIAPLELDVKSKAVCSRFLKSFTFDEVDVLHIFLASESSAEINTQYIIDNLRELYPKMQIVVPRMKNGDGEMECCVLEEDTELEANKWGIPEPKDAETVSEDQVDMVAAPLVGFDSFGNRVGYGKGFYDRFFAKCREGVCKVGLALEEPVFKVKDIEEYDVPLEYCITADRVYVFKKEADTV